MPAQRKMLNHEGEFEELGSHQALSGSLRNKLDDIGRELATRKVLTVPEAGIAMLHGTAIPFKGMVPSAAGAMGAIGLMRAHKRSKLLQKLLGKSQIIPAVAGSAGGFIAGSKLTS